MSNENLSEVGESAVDGTSNGVGHDIDDGPLDPSVFFGLFDGLGDDAESEPAADEVAETLVNGHPPVVTFTPTGAGEANRITDRPVSTTDHGDQTADRGGTVAKVALATIGIGLFAGLVVAFVLSLGSPDAGDPAASSMIDEPPTGLAGAVATGIQPTTELLAEEFAAALPAAMTNRLDLTSLRFEPGTTELDGRSSGVVTELGRLLAEQPAVPVTISVRTYTESTPAANLVLSSEQADALATEFVTAGVAPDQIRVRGLGAAPLSQALPVPNFVVLTPQFGDRLLGEALAGQSPFAFGVPATTTDDVWALRPDGLLAVGQLAETLSAFPDIDIGAAGYSFLPPSQAGIRAEADTAAAELADFLVTAYGIDPGQFTTIIPGSAVFVPTPEHGNHIWLQIGPASQGAFDIASIDPADLTFEPGTADLDAPGLATVQALADILNTGGATIVVDVRSYDAADAAANQALSEARRDTLAAALTTAGVASEQLRLHASGASSYLSDDGGSAITITVAP